VIRRGCELGGVAGGVQDPQIGAYSVRTGLGYRARVPFGEIFGGPINRPVPLTWRPASRCGPADQLLVGLPTLWIDQDAAARNRE